MTSPILPGWLGERALISNMGKAMTLTAGIEPSLFLWGVFFFLAEDFLSKQEGNQNYALLVLKLVEIHSDINIKTAAAILFKNYVRRNWKLVWRPCSPLFLFC